MEFDTKIKLVVLDSLEAWQKLNVVAFLMSGIGGADGVLGKPYQDKDGVEYLSMSKQPVMIHTTANVEEIRDLMKKALTKEVVQAVYTRELFATMNDDDNRAAVARFGTDELDLVGLAVYGKKNHVDKLFKGLPLHK
ncbi:MAG: DUF2000 domain-containing protein [Deltaproteobacteria bacterium]|jgi:hypothetical protein|nr:DUF2000 domain-containing protein [Deltaproteobacteria bacterium]